MVLSRKALIIRQQTKQVVLKTATTFVNGVCEACDGTERYTNGLCAVCSSEREQNERDMLINCIAARGPFKSFQPGMIVFDDVGYPWDDVRDMISCAILYVVAERKFGDSTARLVRVTDEYLNILNKKEAANEQN